MKRPVISGDKIRKLFITREVNPAFSGEIYRLVAANTREITQTQAGPINVGIRAYERPLWPWCFKIYRPSKIFTGPGLLAVVFHKP